jgi:hypothetical protein
MRTQRYDAERTLDSRASRPVDLDAQSVELLRVVGDTVQPAQTSVCTPGVR